MVPGDLVIFPALRIPTSGDGAGVVRRKILGENSLRVLDVGQVR